MSTSDQKKIDILIKSGYKVVINDLKSKSFTKRYSVYQGVGFSSLKAVVIKDDGQVIALQG